MNGYMSFAVCSWQPRHLAKLALLVRGQAVWWYCVISWPQPMYRLLTHTCDRRTGCRPMPLQRHQSVMLLCRDLSEGWVTIGVSWMTNQTEQVWRHHFQHSECHFGATRTKYRSYKRSIGSGNIVEIIRHMCCTAGPVSSGGSRYYSS